MKKLAILAMTGFVLLAGCADAPQVAENQVEKQDENSSDAISASEISDPNLDYALGISNGIYGWTLTEDGNYYMLSSIDEDGNTIESEAAAGFMGKV